MPSAKKDSRDRLVSQLRQKNEELGALLERAEETLRAIRAGEVDAIIVEGPKGERVFSLSETQNVYRLMVETMNEAGLTVSTDGTVLFANNRLAALLQRPVDHIVGRELREFVHPQDHLAIESLLSAAMHGPTDARILLEGPDHSPLPMHMWANLLEQDQAPMICLVGTDLRDVEMSQETILQLQEQRRALAESQQRYQTLVDATFEGIVISQNGTIVDCNDKFAHMLGYSREELIGSPVEDLLPPEDRQRILQSTAQEHEAVIEHEVIRKDGTRIIVQMHGRMIQHHGRRLRLAAIRDITQSKQMTQAVQDSERRFRSSFENAAVGIAHVDLDGRFIRVNNRLCEIVGYECPELLSRNWRDLTHPEDHTGDESHMQRLLVGEVSSTMLERRYLRKDGQEVWLSITRSLQRDEQGSPEHFIAVFQDISQRKKLETMLRQLNEELERKVTLRTRQLSETVNRLEAEVARRTLAEQVLQERSQLLEAFFQHVISPLAFLDSQFNFIRVNEAYARIEGKGVEYFGGKNQFELYPDPDNQAIFTDVVRTHKPYRAFAKPFTHPDKPERGTTYWDWQLTPLLDEQGQVRYLVMNLEDVTERQVALMALADRARQLQRLAMELSQTEERERRRLAGVLHDDLQQLLVGAKIHLDLATGRLGSDERVDGLLQQVASLLDESVTKSRNLSHELSPPTLGQGGLVSALNWLKRQMRSQQALEVELEAEPDCEPSSEAIRIFLYNAAREMLLNVAKHAQVREASVRLRRVGAQIELIVSDAGKGFDPEQLELPHETAGMGLFSIRERSALIGGKMTAHSAPGWGSRFVLTVPDNPEEAQAVQAELAGLPAPTAAEPVSTYISTHRGTGVRVLLVDDHRVVRQGIAALLAEEPDLEVVGQADNGRQAVEMVRSLRPDVVVMDVSMPVLSGVEATEVIKRESPGVRVIGLSMYDEADMSRQMIAAGAETYLAKDGPSEMLVAAIRSGSPAAA